MDASFLCVLAGIENIVLTENAAAYIQSWLKVFKKHTLMFIKAASHAQEAVDYISGLT